MKQVIRLNESQLKSVIAEAVKRVLNEDYDSDYMEAKQIIDGMPFEDVKNLPYRDKRFSFGALNGSEGESMVDLNFKGILITVEGIAKVRDSYEKYNNDGNFIGLS